LAVAKNVVAPQVLGGEEVQPHSIPWEVSYQFYAPGEHGCGGSIVDEITVLTAAHCCEHSIGIDQIVAGEHRISENEGTEQVRIVSRIYVHESYHTNLNPFDVCLLTLEEPLAFNE